MAVTFEFALLYYGKGIVMLADCTLYLITNLLISHLVFVCDIQKLQVASHLKELDSSFQFCCQGPAFTCI